MCIRDRPLGYCEAVLDGCAYVLREVADLRFMAPEDGAGVEREVLVGQAWVVIEQAFQERGFACAIAAHEADFFAAKDVGGEPVDDLVVVVELGCLLYTSLGMPGPDIVKRLQERRPGALYNECFAAYIDSLK